MVAPIFKSAADYMAAYCKAAKFVANASPTLKTQCVLHGSGAASVLHLMHRESWDLDFMGREFMEDVGSIASELKKNLGNRLVWNSFDRESGMYDGRIRCPDLPEIDIQVFKNVHEGIIVSSKPEGAFGGLHAATVGMYAAEKAISCSDRNEEKDRCDLASCFNHSAAAKAVRETLIREGERGVRVVAHKFKTTPTFNLASAGLGYNPATPLMYASMKDWVDERVLRYDEMRKQMGRKPSVSEMDVI